MGLLVGLLVTLRLITGCLLVFIFQNLNFNCCNCRLLYISAYSDFPNISQMSLKYAIPFSVITLPPRPLDTVTYPASSILPRIVPHDRLQKASGERTDRPLPAAMLHIPELSVQDCAAPLSPKASPPVHTPPSETSAAGLLL